MLTLAYKSASSYPLLMDCRIENHHRRRYEGLSQARYLTFSCFRNQSFLQLELACQHLVEAIAATKAKRPFDLWAWVAMPEHVHLLLRPGDGVTVGPILQGIKQSVSLRVIHWAQAQDSARLQTMLDGGPNGNACYRFWQRGGGYDRNIWSTAELQEKIGYIHANPVRRGLVQHPRQWRWSSWSAWHEEGEPVLPVDRASLPPLAP